MDIESRNKEYREKHGELSLKMHVFRTGNSEPLQGLPIFNITEGFPVVVKSHTENNVVLVNMYEGTEFTVSMTSYKLHCANAWFLDEGLRVYNPMQSKKDHEAYKRGMAACGFID